MIKNAYKEEALSFLHNIGNEPVVLLYNSLAVREEMQRVFVREHICASEFANSANSQVISHGVSRCLHPPEGGERIRRHGPFLCAYGTKEAEQNFEDLVLPHDYVITDEPFLVYARPQTSPP
jgi:hypothetical protein